MLQQTGSLHGKYQQLIDAATNAGISDLEVRQQENVLYIDGTASSEQVKQNLWDVYNTIDPDYRSGDLVMNINVAGGTASSSEEEYTVEKGDNLSKIGERYGVSWQEIYEANKHQVKDPDLIQPGWKLKIPAKKQG
jgi:nucleoid-associated protein YgaU